MATDEELDRAVSRLKRTKACKKKVEELVHGLDSFNRKVERLISDEDLREALSASQRVAEKFRAIPRSGAPGEASVPQPSTAEFEHDDDFGTIIWRGRRCELKTDQAIVVQFLYETWQRRMPWQSQAKILELEQLEDRRYERVRNIFKGTELWGKGRLIIPSQRPRGRCRLALEDPPM